MSTRRDFLIQSAAVVSGFLAGPGAVTRAAGRLSVNPGAAPLDMLVLGGTGFIGPHLVRYAVARGHRLTTFTRGRHTADLPNEVARLTGDRNGKLGALEGKRWDVVVDDSATNSDSVR